MKMHKNAADKMVKNVSLKFDETTKNQAITTQTFLFHFSEPQKSF